MFYAFANDSDENNNLIEVHEQHMVLRVNLSIQNKSNEIQYFFFQATEEETREIIKS